MAIPVKKLQAFVKEGKKKKSRMNPSRGEEKDEDLDEDEEKDEEKDEDETEDKEGGEDNPGGGGDNPGDSDEEDDGDAEDDEDGDEEDEESSDADEKMADEANGRIEGGKADEDLMSRMEDFEEDENPPAWVASEATWDRAKAATEKKWDEYEDPWAVVAHVYKQMGGEIK